jgi:hypothetical protein
MTRIGANLADVEGAASELVQRGGEAAADGAGFSAAGDVAVLDIEAVWTGVQTRFADLMAASQQRLEANRSRLAGTDADGNAWAALEMANDEHAAALTEFGAQTEADMEGFKAALAEWSEVFTARAAAVKLATGNYDEKLQELAAAGGVLVDNLARIDTDLASRIGAR